MTEKYFKQELFPTIWCAGCGIGLAVKETAKAFKELGLDNNQISIVSGIGCSGRAAGYFNMDTIHGCHGRAIPVAEGLKRANPKLNVIVFSGDGDIVGIGGNHLIHSPRRDTDITVICINNQTYGLTGGQLAPTSAEGAVTMTSPFGSKYHPVNIQGLILANKRFFYARTTVFHIDHMRKCIKEAMQFKGFSFVEIITNCVETYGKRQGYNNAYEMLMDYKKNFKMASGKDRLEDNEIGIVRKE
ncbi:2-oxoglutarate ferredoxin oxidoreductase subunit beta [Candidatus Woesearchaeota archaeon]|nr:2-oxoglutarate ferredoxin oxidoreductase subunit beta [Candidatus Woesearchaeota archaeon]